MTPSAFDEKGPVNVGPLPSTYREFHVSLNPLNALFWQTIFQPIGVLRPEIFTRARD